MVDDNLFWIETTIPEHPTPVSCLFTKVDPLLAIGYVWFKNGRYEAWYAGIGTKMSLVFAHTDKVAVMRKLMVRASLRVYVSPVQKNNLSIEG